MPKHIEPAADDGRIVRGRPPFKPTEEQRRQVTKMAGLGLRQSDICQIIGISDKTLQIHFRQELDEGIAHGNLKVVQSSYRMATDWMDIPGGVPNREACAMTCFLMKTRPGLRYQEIQRHEHAGTEEGGPIKIVLSQTDADL